MSEPKVVVEKVRQWVAASGAWRLEDDLYHSLPRALLTYVPGVEVPEWVPEIGERVQHDAGAELSVRGTPYWNGRRWCVRTNHGESHLTNLRPIQKPEKVTGEKVGSVEIVDHDGCGRFDFGKDGLPRGTYVVVRVDEGGDDD